MKSSSTKLYSTRKIKQMASANTIKTHWFKILRLSEEGGLCFDMVYRGHIYIIDIKPTGVKAVHPMTGRKMLKKKVPLKFGECETCGDLLVSGICINKSCTDPALTE